MVRILYVMLIAFFYANLYAANTISSDSLLQRVKSGESIYDVIDKININNIDYKDVYFNEELKPYMLQLLDEESYRLHDIKTYLESSFGSDNAKKHRIAEWLRDNNSSLSIDTVLSTPYLFQTYLDTAYNDYSLRLYQKYKPVIPNKFEELLCRVRWPEVYEEYHRQWVEDGMNLTSKRFYAMLCMHDPDAIDMFNKYVDDLLQNNDESLNRRIYTQRPSSSVLGSYNDKLWLRGLEYTNLITYTPYLQENDKDLIIPYNVKVIESWLPFLMADVHISAIVKQILEKVSVSMEFMNNTFVKLNENLTIDEYISIGNEIKENVQLFWKEWQPYINKKEQDELYWKQNMPYYTKDSK